MMKKILQLLCMFLFATFAVQAQVVATGGTVNIDGVLYTVTNDGAGTETVNIGDNGNQGATSGTDGTAIGALVIPATITSAGITYTVTGTEFQAFASNSSITSVDMSAATGVTELSQQTFAELSNCSSIVLPNTITKIGRACFQSTPITTLNTSSVTDLGTQSAMDAMGSLTSVDFSNVLNIGKRSFRGANAMTILEIPAITSLGQDAITSSSLTTLSVGPNLSSLDANAFNLGALTTVNWDVLDPAALSPIFRSATLANVTVYVPAAVLTDYQNNAYWSGLGLAAIVAQPTLGNENVTLNAEVSVSPNPTSGVVSINGVDNANLTVLDISGRVLLTATGSQIDLSGLAQGVYIVKGQTANGSFAKRVVKQ